MSGPIAMGGMASVHLGKLTGPVGFRRTVAIKRMLTAYAADPRARAMLIDEARLAARVSHSNVVQTLDVVEQKDELFLILEYVHGESLDRLLERCKELGQRPALPVVIAILVGVLRGLHAAHEAKSEDGQPLELVHRDLSPSNIIVDVHGVARVLDFGVARARGRLQGTRDDQLKGKLAYLAPEQVHGEASRRSDLFTAGVVLWESLCGRQLFAGMSEADTLGKVLLCKVPTLESQGVAAPALQAILDCALDREPERRHRTAGELADALEKAGPASASEVAAWVGELARENLSHRARLLEDLDRLASAPEPAPAPAAAPKGAASSTWRTLALLAVGGLGVSALWVAAQRPDPVIPTPAAAPIVTGRAEPAPDPDPEPAPTVVPAAAGPTTPDAGPPRDPTPRAPVPPLPPRKNPKSASPPPGVACDPPFVIDSSGVKRFKVECLR
ncbi:MAG: serine/threonine-protein kinase [Myxococcaceae bacterium]